MSGNQHRNNLEQKRELEQKHESKRVDGETKNNTGRWLPNYDQNNNRWLDGPRLRGNNLSSSQSDSSNMTSQQIHEQSGDFFEPFMPPDTTGDEPMLMVSVGETKDSDSPDPVSEQAEREEMEAELRREREAEQEIVRQEIAESQRRLGEIEGLYDSDTDSDYEGGGMVKRKNKTKKRKNKTKKKAKNKTKKRKNKIKEKKIKKKKISKHKKGKKKNRK